MLAYTYKEKDSFSCKKNKTNITRKTRCYCKSNTCKYLCQRFAHKIRKRSKAIPGITVGHEMVGIVESVGTEVTTVKPGDRVAVNVETFCGHCFLQTWLCQ